MTDIPMTTWLGMAVLFGLVFSIMLMAYDGGEAFGLYKKIKCKMGKHAHKIGYRKNVNKYFCKHCKAPRKHPALRAIDGGKVDLDVTFRF